MPHKTTLSDAIYIAKGFGITFVVMGHYQMGHIVPEYWESIRKIIYTFHMPLFMALSGYLFNQSFSTNSVRKYYDEIIKNKIKRLLYPYITLSIILLIVKVTAGFIATLQLPVDKNFYKYILFNPVGGFSTMLWFLYTLFIIHLIFPFFRFLIKNDTLLMISVLVLSYFNWPKEFCLNLAMHHLPYFIAGYLVAKNNFITAISFRWSLSILFASILLYIFTLYDIFEKLDTSHTTTLLIGYIGIAIVIFTSLLISNYKFKYFCTIFLYIKTIGSYSSCIYLFHTLCMGPVRIFLTKIQFIDTFPFIMSVFIVCSSGIIFPILIQKHIINHVPLARKLIIGAK